MQVCCYNSAIAVPDERNCSERTDPLTPSFGGLANPLIQTIIRNLFPTQRFHSLILAIALRSSFLLSRREQIRLSSHASASHRLTHKIFSSIIILIIFWVPDKAQIIPLLRSDCEEGKAYLIHHQAQALELLVSPWLALRWKIMFYDNYQQRFNYVPMS
jgi:hypothetical protein